MSSKCRSCHAPIVWARHEGSGKPMPLEEAEQGSFVLEEVAGTTYASYVGEPHGDYESHFANCPDADDWRKDD